MLEQGYIDAKQLREPSIDFSITSSTSGMTWTEPIAPDYHSARLATTITTKMVIVPFILNFLNLRLKHVQSSIVNLIANLVCWCIFTCSSLTINKALDII